MAEVSENTVQVEPEEEIAIDASVTICPMCGTEILPDAIECPSCGEPFSPEAFKKRESKKDKRNRWLFYSGVILVLVGGPGVALGSWLHDLLQVPIADYDNFDTFGWANVLVSTVGIIILVIGIILLILSLPRMKSEESLKEEEEAKRNR